MLETLRRLIPLIERSQATLSAAARSVAIGGLSPGSRVPPFGVEAVDGGLFTEADLGQAPSIVLFLESRCKACDNFVKDLEQGRVPEVGVRLVVVSSDRREADKLARSGDVTVVVGEDPSLALAFHSRVSPQDFLVDESGVVMASGTPSEWESLALT